MDTPAILATSRSFAPLESPSSSKRMKGTTELPHEILVAIFDLATAAANEDAASSDELSDKLREGDAGIATAWSLCRVCRTWNGPATGRLYRDWIYHGEIHSVQSIWRFVVTILTNPKLAALVRTVELRNWDWGDCLDWSEHGSLGQDMEQYCTAKEKEAIVKAWKGIGSLPQDWSEAVSRLAIQSAGVPWSACMALALAYMANLSSLRAGVRRDSSWVLTQVFTTAATGKVMSHNHPIFSNLTDLQLHGEWRNDGYNDGANGPISLRNWVKPVFGLPSLERLSLFDLSFDDSLSVSMELARSSSIKHMTIQNSALEKSCRKDTDDDVWALLAIPRSLSSLTLYLYLPSIRRFGNELSYEFIDRVVSQHAQTLEHLNVQDIEWEGTPSMNDIMDKAFMEDLACRLPQLTSLKHLACDIAYLWDDRNHTLSGNLPASLETLALTVDSDTWSTWSPLSLLESGNRNGPENLRFVSAWDSRNRRLMDMYWGSKGGRPSQPWPPAMPASEIAFAGNAMAGNPQLWDPPICNVRKCSSLWFYLVQAGTQRKPKLPLVPGPPISEMSEDSEDSEEDD